MLSVTKVKMSSTLLLLIVISLIVPVLDRGKPLRSAEHPVAESPLWLTYLGDSGPSLGKHVILIAADQEYRSEHSMPMPARLLAKHHGFHCTVLFSLHQDNAVDPTQKIRCEDNG